MTYQIPKLPLPIDLETKPILKQLNQANRRLAELKGLVQTIPNESLLINTLGLQEAKDSSEIENIVTTHDDLFKSELDMAEVIKSAAAKEVKDYREAIQVGFNAVRENGLITNNVIKQVQMVLLGNSAGFRKVPGTTLKDRNGTVVYTPPQDARDIVTFMDDLEQYTNNPDDNSLDPLIKMAVIHHQFESIHPFLNGNGRTGRIISILYLVAQDLLNLPVLYLSRYITHNKNEYYQKLQAIRDNQENNETQWQDWVMFMLRGIEETSRDTIVLVKNIRDLMAEYKKILRPIFDKRYHYELLNNLFYHPYTKIEFMQEAMQVSRITATHYLDAIVSAGLLEKVKMGRSNYYINTRLVAILQNPQGASSLTNEQ